MHIELIGCTSAGKTTLAQKIILNGKRQGIDIILGDDFVLQKLHLNWVKNEYLRRRFLEICAGYICLRHWKKYSGFRHFVLGVVKQTPGSSFYKANLVRIVLRKIGIHELIRHSSSENQLVLVDNEGIVQAAHNLFVHTSSINGNLTNFINSAPLPDIIVYLRQPQQVLLARTLRRGHPRIQNRSKSKVQFFVKQAAETFEKLQILPPIAERLFVIDGENKEVIKTLSRKGDLVNQTYDILKKSIKDNHTNGEPASPKQLEFPSLDLISSLAQQLHAQGVCYCHWKSNIKLEKSLQGIEDLDFFVGQQSVSQLFSIMDQLGFKDAKIRFGPETQGVTHHYGFDKTTGKLVHVHLFKNLLTGESFVKSHNLPLGTMLLKNLEIHDNLAVVSKPAELVLFVLRMFIKYGSLPDLLHLYGESEDIRHELKWLLENDNIGKSVSLLNEHCPAVEEPLFLSCIEAIYENHSFIKKILLARQVRKRLRKYAKYTFFTRTQAYSQLFLAKWKRVLKGNLKNKTLCSGGAVIAFVGADATGKSTLVSETERWLGKVFAVKKVHVGKPPPTILTVIFKIALPLVRRLLPQLRGSQIQTMSQGKKSSKSSTKGPSSILYAIRALALAWERYRLLLMVGQAKARGELIICDRYPSGLTGAMDSPRLKEKLNKNGLKVALYNWLARNEQKVYNRMPLPDIMIKLNVSLETAKKRNLQRIKEEKDTDEFIEARHQGAHEWHISGIKNYFEINTEQSISATIINTKKAIWESL